MVWMVFKTHRLRDRLTGLTKRISVHLPMQQFTYHVGSQLKTLSEFEPRVWLKIITSSGASNACLKL